MIALAGEAREVALAEAQAVLAMARDDDMRRGWPSSSRRSTTARSTTDAELLEQVLELGLQTGRIRAYYGPGGEQAALRTLRRLPRGTARAESAREVSKALATLDGQASSSASADRGGRARHVPALVDAGGLEALRAPRRVRRSARERGDMSDAVLHGVPRPARSRRASSSAAVGSRREKAHGPARLRREGHGRRARRRRRARRAAGRGRAAAVPRARTSSAGSS